jgi:NAD(P)-dependent dehydrogenase (short-subunit alcohol dehydrogenase family)
MSRIDTKRFAKTKGVAPWTRSQIIRMASVGARTSDLSGAASQAGKAALGALARRATSPPCAPVTRIPRRAS